MKSEVKEEIQTYIRYINENDLRDKCEEYIQMFFFSIANDVRREFGSGRKSNSVNGAKDGRTTGTGSGYRFCFSE